MTDFITVDGGERVGHPAPGTKMNWTEKGEGEKKKRDSGFRGDQERRFRLNLKGGKKKYIV